MIAYPHPVSTHTGARTSIPSGRRGRLLSGKRSGRGERLLGFVSCVLELLLCFPPCLAPEHAGWFRDLWLEVVF